MTRRLLSLLCAALMIFASATALAVDNGADPLTRAELLAWAAKVEETAAGELLLNDPTAEESLTEDGYAYVYEFGTLYYSDAPKKEDSRLLGLVIYDENLPGPRDTNTMTTAVELLNSFYTENESLLGSRESALIYLTESMPEGVWWAMVQRDGQRIEAVQYTAHERLADDLYSDCGLVFTLQQNSVVAIRAFGLDSAADAAAVAEEMKALGSGADTTDYAMVPSDPNGSCPPFGEEDLGFMGIDFLTCTPEQAASVLGEPEADELVEDEEGAVMRVQSYDGCTLVFRTGDPGETPVLTMMTIDGEELEGPRALRFGDSVSAVLARFRSGEGELDETMTEVLYGSEEAGAWGLAEYGDDASATVRYGLTLEDGRKVVLMASFEQLYLTEINLYLAQ